MLDVDTPLGRIRQLFVLDISIETCSAIRENLAYCIPNLRP